MRVQLYCLSSAPTNPGTSLSSRPSSVYDPTSSAPMTALESPAFATQTCPSLYKATTAVVPLRTVSCGGEGILS